MRKYGYSGALATGTLAAGGTLGILVPPSIPLVVYAILTEQNIAKLFLAAFIPAALAVIGFFIAIRGYIYFHPRRRTRDREAAVRRTRPARGRDLARDRHLSHRVRRHERRLLFRAFAVHADGRRRRRGAAGDASRR